MSYEVTYVPTEEKMKSYEYQGCEPKKYAQMHREIVLGLISTCLRAVDSQTNPIEKLVSKISNAIEQLVFLAKLQEYGFAYREWKREKEITYFQDEYDVETDEELEDEKTRTIKDLYIIASVVDTPDFFEDRDNFEELVREIEEIIEEFEENVQGYYIHEIQEDLKEFKKNYDLDEILSDNNSEETDNQE